MVWLQVIPPAVCYFLFNWQFFRCVESGMKIDPLQKKYIVRTFILNYGTFILMGLLGLHLIVNWIIFLILLLAEQMMLYHMPFRKCALFALLGTQLGLAVNILFRSLFAILFNVPLIVFDNSILNPGNMKIYPVLLGFLVVGLLFMLIIRFDMLKNVTLITEDQNTTAFLLGLLVAMYFYLCMNLTVYYVEENNQILKLWSMKSAVFVITGEWLSLILSIRLGRISVYRTKSREAQEQMAREQARELELRVIAATDPLTGCDNRYQAQPRLQEAMAAGGPFCLGFVDLNRLKTVNDGFGHEMGDKYILAVSGVLRQACRQGDFLFRYGGDEFLLLLHNATSSEAAGRLQQAQQRLDEKCGREAYPFSMEFSYGIATPGDGASAAELIEVADGRMYQMKRMMH